MPANFTKMMKQEGLKDEVIRTFLAYYQKLIDGDKGYIGKDQIKPPAKENLLHYEDLKPLSDPRMLKRTAVIKLNGGLGTSMGLSKAKSLLPVKGNMNFLDIISRQILTLRAQSGYDVVLLFMNSYNTDADTLNYLGKYPDLTRQELPLSFVQNKFPRIRQDNLQPLVTPDKSQMWNPPGHGDIYTALSSGGLLERLIITGYRYAFISNADNLGATVDSAVPAYMEKHEVPFVMEVCQRTESDKKGGHLSEDHNGQLLLREIAQCPAEEMAEFQDVSFYNYFNTNNLWIDLKALEWQMISAEGLLLLPLIVNPKTVDSVPVYQLETAMGAAISMFKNSKALVVPRTRFAPVKKTNDLLAVWSDVYELNDQYQIILKRGLEKPPEIDLDDVFYGQVDGLQQRFPTGTLSLSGCKKLKVTGDVTFGDQVICEGKVELNARQPVKISNRLLTGILELNA